MAVSLVVALILLPCNQAKAANVNLNVNDINTEQTLDISTLTQSDNLEISEPMSYSEITQRMAQTERISIEEARTKIDPPSTQSLTTKASYTSTYATTSSTFREIKANLYVTSEYIPKMVFYCNTSESGQYWGINTINDIYIDRAYTYQVWVDDFAGIYGHYEDVTITKGFTDDTYVKLNTAYSITYRVTGDFFNNATATHSSGLTSGINVEGCVTINFTCSTSTSSNHYAYFNTGYVRKNVQ